MQTIGQKLILYLIVICLVSLSSASAEIIKTNNFAVIKDRFLVLKKNYDPNNIIGLIGYNSLIKPTNPALSQNDANYNHLLSKLATQLKPANKPYLKEVLLVNFEHALVDSHIAQFIQEISAEKIPIIAISTNLTGNFGKINRLEVWLANYLQKFGLNFASSFPQNNDLTLPNLETSRGPVTFYNGILNCPDESLKIAAFVRLLLVLKHYPQIVVMVDSDATTLNNMQNQLRSFNPNITFIGYHYTPSQETIEISSQEFIDFWQEVINKANKVAIKAKLEKGKQTNSKKKVNPYEE